MNQNNQNATAPEAQGTPFEAVAPPCRTDEKTRQGLAGAEGEAFCMNGKARGR
jgi:hypothetical protein